MAAPPPPDPTHVKTTDIPIYPDGAPRGQWPEFYVKKWLPFVAHMGHYWAYHRLYTNVPDAFPTEPDAQAAIVRG